MKRILVACAAVVAVWSNIGTAQAEPWTEKSWLIGGHLAYGVSMEGEGLNPYGFGFGARGGYTFVPNIYVGGLFEFFLGESERAGALGVGGSASARAWLLQGEVGYDFGVARNVVLRPKAGLGLTNLTGEGCVSASVPFVGDVTECTSRSRTRFAFGVGLEVPIDLGPVYLAPEARFNIVDDASAFILAVGVGGVI